MNLSPCTFVHIHTRTPARSLVKVNVVIFMGSLVCVLSFYFLLFCFADWECVREGVHARYSEERARYSSLMCVRARAVGTVKDINISVCVHTCAVLLLSLFKCPLFY